MPTIAGYKTTEKLFEGSTTVIFKAYHPATGKKVVLKLLKGDHPQNTVLNRFRQEYELISSFDSSHIIKSYGLKTHHHSLVMVLEDCLDDFGSLADIVADRPLTLEQFLQLSIELTRGLEVIHNNRIIYRDFKPDNILISRDYSRIKLFDFNIAARDDNAENGSHIPRLPEGTISYLSPEQTGRIEQSVDYRTDFYALGVTLFQLVTGQLPFSGDNPGEIIHAHLAQKPPSPSRLDSSIPLAISSIILKLLEKNKSRRYQTCQGILLDLKHCLQELHEQGAIGEIEPGEHDRPHTLHLPSQLYQRHDQLQLLSAGFARASTGAVEIIFISGPPGVGKSSLVQEFNNRLAREETYFLHGVFEPTLAASPYATIISALRQLVRHILSESGIRISRWKADLQEIVDDSYGFLAHRIPELERILPLPKPAVNHDLHSDEQRLLRMFHDFLQVCCRTGPPLVLFLDDLHHADAASLRVLEHLLTSAQLGRLLFIGSYRDMAREPRQPLLQWLESLAASRLKIQSIELGNLQENDIGRFLSHALDRREDEVWELAAICLGKTDGNPLYLKEFLLTMNREGHLYYAPGTRCWEWDKISITKSQPTENRVEIVMQGIRSLPRETWELLTKASCLGESFSLRFLATLHDADPEDCAKALRHALDYGCLLTLAEDKGDTDGRRYLFASQRLRHAILSLMQPGELTAIHLRAGSYLLATLKGSEYQNRIYEIADHLNQGLPCAGSGTERLSIARVNLDAGRKAVKAEEFARAHGYITAGLRALPEGSWQNEYALSLELHATGCETGFLCGRYDEVKQHFQIVLALASDIYDRCRVYRTYIKSLKAQSLPGQAVSACLEVLSLLGVRIPEQPGRLRGLLSLLLSWIRLRRFNQAALLALPEMTDSKALVIMGFLYEAATAAYSANPSLLPLVSGHALHLSLKHGNCQESSVTGYLIFGLLLCSLSGRHIDLGHRIGQLALELDKRFERDLCQPSYVFNSFISHWKTSIHDTIPPLAGTLKAQFGRGDLESTANAAYSLTFRQFLVGTNLDGTRSEIDRQYEFVRQLNQHLPLTRLQILGQAVANLKGENDDPRILEGRYFNAKESLAACLAAGDYTSYCIATILQMIHAVLFNDYPLALAHSRQARRYLDSLAASVFLPVFYLYDSLARLAGYDQLTSPRKLQTRLAVHFNQRKMKRWARHAPWNYDHKYSLVEAELQRIRGNTERAMEWYDTAIHQARQHAFLHEEALAYEFAAKFYTSRRKSHIARSYLQEARYCYYRWGATAKVRQLDSQEWVSKGRHINLQPQETSALSGTSIPGAGASRLDMLTVIRASRILSSEMVLDELLKKMMRIMLESAGAQRGFLIFKDRQEWIVKVRGSIYRSSIVTLTDTPITSQMASTAIINYVIHAAKDVVLNDACKEGIFIHDSYILQKKPRSILCMPIMYQGDIFCILYLENNLAAGAFPPDRQELLHLLGTQAAIALNNSSLFAELEGTVDLLNSEVEKRRSTQQQLLHAEKLSALGRLSASIAHEFGNPLMGVKYLLDDFHKRKNLGDGDRQLIELGLEECERMKSLIRDLQRLNKPSSGKLTRTDVHQLIDNVLLFQKKYFSSHRIRIRRQYDHSLPEVEVIIDQITQVLFNLTINAVDAMAAEGGVLTITTGRQEHYIRIGIADTGSGISEKNQERIFEPFFSTKKEEDGTGLGLSISYGIARYHGGDLSFVSTAGQGTTFTLSLPCAPAMETEHEAKDENKL